MTCTENHHPLVAGGLDNPGDAFIRDFRGPPGGTWASQCFGEHCFRWNRHADQVVVDGDSGLTVFNAPYRLRVEDDPLPGVVRVVSIVKDTPDDSPRQRVGCRIYTQDAHDRVRVTGPAVVFLNGGAVVPLPDGYYPHPHVVAIRAVMYARLHAQGAQSATFVGDAGGWYRRLASECASPRFLDGAALAPTPAPSPFGGDIRGMWDHVRGFHDRFVATLPRIVVNPEVARRIEDVFGPPEMAGVVVSPHVPAGTAYVAAPAGGGAYGLAQWMPFDRSVAWNPGHMVAGPGPTRPATVLSPRPDGVGEWGLVLLELREYARRMGTHLLRTGEKRLFHRVEVAVGVEPGRVEKFGLQATRSPGSGVVRVRGDRDLGMLWSSDPFTLLGHGGKGNGDDTFWGDHLVRDDPGSAPAAVAAPDRPGFRLSGLRVEGLPGVWTGTYMATRSADGTREGGA